MTDIYSVTQSVCYESIITQQFHALLVTVIVCLSGLFTTRKGIYLINQLAPPPTLSKGNVKFINDCTSDKSLLNFTREFRWCGDSHSYCRYDIIKLAYIITKKNSMTFCHIGNVMVFLGRERKLSYVSRKYSSTCTLRGVYVCKCVLNVEASFYPTVSITTESIFN